MSIRARVTICFSPATRPAPWYVLRSDDKKRARLNLITHLLSKIPYEDVPRDKVKLPKRGDIGKYKGLDYQFKFVPEEF